MEIKNAEDVRSFIRSRMEATMRVSISNMRMAGLSNQYINDFIAEQMVQIEKECERAVAEYERLRDHPDAASLATH